MGGAAPHSPRPSDCPRSRSRAGVAGRREDALAAITEAVSICRLLAEDDPEAFCRTLRAACTTRRSASARWGCGKKGWPQARKRRGSNVGWSSNTPIRAGGDVDCDGQAGKACVTKAPQGSGRVRRPAPTARWWRPSRARPPAAPAGPPRCRHDVPRPRRPSRVRESRVRPTRVPGRRTGPRAARRR